MRPKRNSSRMNRAIRPGSTTVESSMVRTTNVTSYIFRAPEPYKLAIFIIIISIFAGFFLNFKISHFNDNFLPGNVYDNAIIFGLILIGIPAILSAVISTPFANLSGGIFYYRRSFLLAFLSVFFLIMVLLLGKVLGLFYKLDFIIIFIFGYALIFSVRHTVFLATSNPKNLNSILGSINQTLFGYLFLWFIPGTGFKITGQEISYMFWFTIIFFLTTLLWLRIITTPFRRNFGVNGLLLMKHALTQFTEDTQAGQILEKDFFEKIGSNSDLRVGVICIREKANPGQSGRSSQASQPGQPSKLKVLIIIPSIHPGPFGILGGSNLPSKLLGYLKGLATNVMVFHGPATHDQNPVSTQECLKIAKIVRRLVYETKYTVRVSTLHRATMSAEDFGSKQDPKHHFTPPKHVTSMAGVRRDNLTICGQRFGNGIIYTHTSSPESTDDIDNPLGEVIIRKAETETKTKALFIDAHNCLKPGTGVVFFNSEKANNMLKLVSKLNKELKSATAFKLNTGFASDENFSISEGFGPMGIQVLIIKCNPMHKPQEPKGAHEIGEYQEHENRTCAYILLDGNNVIPGLRERILDAIDGLVDDAEVFTTDNHIVNATMGGYNPIGLKANPERIVKQVQNAVKKAIRKIGPSEVGVNSGIVKNIRILGQNTPMRLSATINSTISIMGNSLVACQALALTACWLITLI